ncbi:MAG TPA: hypothetical protein VFJ43_09325 [Bacteroidia bacterium]|nr:hypothetical protein [Bacteroidia bacterium]
MAFTGNEGEDFPMEIAAKWTANYRAQNPKGIKAHFFGEKILMRAIREKHCIGLRMYYALDDEGMQQIIVVGVDKQGNDLCSGIVMDRAVPCPPYCDGGGSPLNG